MTPELLWSLKLISPNGISDDGDWVVYSSSTYDIDSNSKETKTYRVPVEGGVAEEIDSAAPYVLSKNISPNGVHRIFLEDAKVKPISGEDFYPDMKLSKVQIYDNLAYRHWDVWEDGKFSHVCYASLTSNDGDSLVDIMENEPYDCPQKPFGGAEDYTWNTESTKILYVAKKKYGKEYALSTNSDIYSYDLATGLTENLTVDNDGYDTQPIFSKSGQLSYLQMKEDGNEANKNDVVVVSDGRKQNLTENWDGTVNSSMWSDDGQQIYFVAPTDGTVQLFAVGATGSKSGNVRQITSGQSDVRSMVGISGNNMIISRTDMNHAVEIFSVDLDNGEMTQLTHANDAIYDGIQLSEVRERTVKTTDGKDMLCWVIYPPGFDESKSYPTLLYAQGGPQSALSQFYSLRWNFQLMAANGYVIIAPNRRGMPGHGVEWNAEISGDWGGQCMQDYLSAIDDISKESYVDKNRVGCVGASFGGYSAFYLAGIHEKRFKSFIAHDGVFNLNSMYGTTEELFFVHHEMGGPYWDAENRKSYEDFNPITRVDNWDTPILIIQGGKDYRVPIGQGLEAFQAAQMKGIKSKLLYFPEENHWILSAQNGIVWQREFFGWLEETLK